MRWLTRREPFQSRTKYLGRSVSGELRRSVF